MSKGHAHVFELVVCNADGSEPRRYPIGNLLTFLLANEVDDADTAAIGDLGVGCCHTLAGGGAAPIFRVKRVRR